MKEIINQFNSGKRVKDVAEFFEVKAKTVTKIYGKIQDKRFNALTKK